MWGVKLLWIGGGITGDVQVGDTHKHNQYQQQYRQVETADAAHQLSLRPHRLPSCSRADVLDRAWHAWEQVPHDHPERGYIQDGCLNPLQDDGDIQLASELFPVWMECEMPRRRQELIAEVEARWAPGEYTCWDDFWSDGFLLTYDAHEGIHEGMEGAPDE